MERIEKETKVDVKTPKQNWEYTSNHNKIQRSIVDPEPPAYVIRLGNSQ